MELINYKSKEDHEKKQRHNIDQQQEARAAEIRDQVMTTFSQFSGVYNGTIGIYAVPENDKLKAALTLGVMSKYARMPFNGHNDFHAKADCYLGAVWAISRMLKTPSELTLIDKDGNEYQDEHINTVIFPSLKDAEKVIAAFVSINRAPVKQPV